MDILKQPMWRIIDQSISGLNMDPKQSFAMDDTLCQSIGQGFSPYTARTWVHPHTVILGIQDSRLPYLKEGVDLLKSRGYNAVVRNSGGLAVVLDEGVLNISLIMPEKNKTITIDMGYEAMVWLIEHMLRDFTHSIVTKEVVGSYCPGRYDLSIDGKKFAGISQRRIRGGVAVQIYLCVNGSGSERARLVRDFYGTALKGETTKFEYPAIDPDTMSSMSELFHTSLTVQDVMLLFYKTMQTLGAIQQGSLSPEEAAYFESHLIRMIERNEKAFM